MKKIIILSLFSLLLIGCGDEEKQPKEQWYWADDYCWKDFILYKSFMENGVCSYEILNNMKEHDILLTVQITDGGKYIKEMSYQINAGKTTGIIRTDLKKVVTMDIVSVIKVENGVTTQIMECEKKYY